MAEYFRCNKCNGTFDPAHTYCPNCDVVAVKELEAENARLREELAAAQADAKRYQWLVVEKSDAADLQSRWDYCYNAWSGCDGADGFTAVIDDAIAKENGK